MKWSDLTGTAIVTDVQAGDYLGMLRTSDGADGSKIILVEDAIVGLMALLTSITIPKLTVTTQIDPPCAELTFSGDVTLVDGTDKTLLFLNTGGVDRNLSMPPNRTGLSYFLMHVGGGQTITIKDNGGSTITTLEAGEGKSLVYSGSAWRVY